MLGSALALSLLSCSSAPQSAPATSETEAAKHAKYEGQLVRLQGMSEDESKIYLVRNGKKHWVMSPAWLDAHRSELKGDVNIVTKEELDSIPTGDPLQ